MKNLTTAPNIGEAFERQKLQEKITNYPKELDPNQSIMSGAIHSAIQTAFNFENVIKLCVDQYNDNPDAMIRVVGQVPMLLILKYNRLYHGTK